MVGEARIGRHDRLDHEAPVLVGIRAMHAILGQHLRQHIDEVTRLGNLEFDQQILQTNAGIEAADPLKRLTPKEQCGRRRARR